MFHCLQACSGIPPTSIQRYNLFGGQGTMNVNSWSPRSDRFAFVAYPVEMSTVDGTSSRGEL
jgi:hypothetical protein